MKITIRNRLAVLIRERKLNSASEFGRRMTEVGFELSSSQASRYMKNDPPPFTVKFVQYACNVLQCFPNDFYEIVIEYGPNEVLDPTVVIPHHAKVIGGTPERQPSSSNTQEISLQPGTKNKLPWEGKHPIGGPKVTPFPKKLS